MKLITQDTHAPTNTERLSDYFAKPAAIERRPMAVLPWDRSREYERQQMEDALSDDEVAEAAFFHFHGSGRSSELKDRSRAGTGLPAQPTNGN